MRRLIAVGLFLILSQEAFSIEAIFLHGACYDVEIVRPELSSKNTFTICIDEDLVSSRMIFSNPQSLSAVCYQAGRAKMTKSNNLHITLEEGYCDNFNDFSADNLTCSSGEAGVFLCHSPHGELVLKPIWSLK